MQFSATFVTLASAILLTNAAPIPGWTGNSNVHHWNNNNGNSWQADYNNPASWNQPQNGDQGDWNPNTNNYNNNWQQNNNNQNSWNGNNQQQPPNNVNQPPQHSSNGAETVRLQLQLDAGETTFVQETINVSQITPSRQQTVFEVDLIQAPEGTYCQILDFSGVVAGFSAGQPAQIPQGVRNPSFLCAAPQN